MVKKHLLISLLIAILLLFSGFHASGWLLQVSKLVLGDHFSPVFLSLSEPFYYKLTIGIAFAFCAPATSILFLIYSHNRSIISSFFWYCNFFAISLGSLLTGFGLRLLYIKAVFGNNNQIVESGVKNSIQISPAGLELFFWGNFALYFFGGIALTLLLLLRKDVENICHQFDNASWDKRLLNFLIDQVICYGVTISVMLVLRPYGINWISDYFNFVYFALILFLYYLILETIFGRTPAKMITRTMGVDLSGQKPGTQQCFYRNFLRFLPFEAFSFLGKGKFPVGWHDRFSQTRVVNLVE